ncbi:MAG: glycosyltransferase family 4 protein [Bacteroidales bacterium]|nr:glycosyltransferase family 4 protein [Bacteroidales bacterium]
MKILMVHNDYGVYSGEEAVVDRMIADGRNFGYNIEVLRRTSKFSRDSLIGKWRSFFNGFYSPSGRWMMREALRTFRPDIVHIHNLYPFISPPVLFLCKKAGVPVVMTVHNYRLICPTGLFLRDGRSCENCLRNGNEWDCIRHNCENSMTRSVAYALRNMVARKTGAYRKCVDYFCCLTVFQKQKLLEAGYDADKIFVFPNYVEVVTPTESDKTTYPWQQYPGGFVGYVGRYHYAKGTDLLIEVARRNPELPFCIAGSMDETQTVDLPKNVTVCGILNQEELAAFYEAARFVVLPSRCYEGFPLVMLEAFGHGKCCVAPNHGAFPDLMQHEGQNCGRLFTPVDIEDLERQTLALWNDKTACEELGILAKANYRARFEKQTRNIAWDKFLRLVAANAKSAKSTTK